jgi:hypothetical protein
VKAGHVDGRVPLFVIRNVTGTVAPCAPPLSGDIVKTGGAMIFMPSKVSVPPSALTTSMG